MVKSDFHYFLPNELIAQSPIDKRDNSKLLVLDKLSGEITHTHFYNLIDYLNENDILIFNDSKVIPARLYGTRFENENSNIEILLLKEIKKDLWEVLVKPSKKAKIGSKFYFCEKKVLATVIDDIEDGKKLFKFDYNNDFFHYLKKYGEMPLPPYIKEKLKDNDRYQTIYANDYGSSAAPTAGLHFTKDVFNKLNDKNIKCLFVTLHVGLGTFRPVKENNLKNHIMHSENFILNQNVVDEILDAKKRNSRVICVGTTSLRVLEGVYKKYNKLIACKDETDIFIYPPYEFNVVDSLITNFHLPESTLIMLTSAFGGYENVMKAYKDAVNQKYKFFSFGDCMLIK